jgi:hypothetical protein
MFWPIKLFLSLWFGFALLMVALTVVSVVTEGTTNAQQGLRHSMVVIGGGVAIVWAGKWGAKHDPEWLAYVIRRALS